MARRLGLGEVPAFDLAAVCSGFVYGLAVADGMIAAGTVRRALLIGADTFSTILDPADRASATVFGDGAGAVVLRVGKPDEPGAVLGFDLGSDGYLAELIMTRAGGSRHPDRDSAEATDRWLAVRGQAIHRHAVIRMTAAARAAMNRLVAHQANARILATVGANLGIEPDRVYANIATVGDSSRRGVNGLIAMTTYRVHHALDGDQPTVPVPSTPCSGCSARGSAAVPEEVPFGIRRCQGSRTLVGGRCLAVVSQPPRQVGAGGVERAVAVQVQRVHQGLRGAGAAHLADGDGAVERDDR